MLATTQKNYKPKQYPPFAKVYSHIWANMSLTEEEYEPEKKETLFDGLKGATIDGKIPDLGDIRMEGDV